MCGYICLAFMVTSPLGLKAREAATIALVRDTYIHLWCDTSRPLDGQHGNFLLLLRTSRHFI